MKSSLTTVAGLWLMQFVNHGDFSNDLADNVIGFNY